MDNIIKEITNKDNKIRVFVVGDTHFGHDNIIKYCGRPFTAIEQDSIMIKKWNQAVNPEDIVIHVGDFALHKSYEHYSGVMKQLNGRKILIRGNHDRKSNHFYMTNGFDFICDEFRWGTVLFTHRPIDMLPRGIRYNIHGHTHEKTLKDKKYWINVSVEQIKYQPVLIDHLVNTSALGRKRT